MNLLPSAVRFLNRYRKLGAYALRCVPDLRHRISIDHIGGFDIRLRRNYSLWIRSPLARETIMLGYLERLIRPGDTVYDVGANLGLYTRFALHFGAGCVIAFEPVSANIALLRRNVELAHARAGDVRIMELAVGDVDGSELLQVDDVMSSTASLDRVCAGEASFGRKLYGLSPLTQRVPVATLDALVYDGHLPPPRVMKIDIEGAEVLALKGGMRVLREHRPALAIELHSEDLARGVLAVLDELGYHSYARVFEAGKSEFRRVTTESAGALRAYDYVVASVEPERLALPVELFQ